MKPIIELLESRISAVMSELGSTAGDAAIIKPASDPKFGDYQVNGVMALAKRLRTNPRVLAQDIVDKLDLSDICSSVEIAGPGFINLTLSPAYLAESLIEIASDTSGRLGVDKVTDSRRVVVDFSGPNIAKQMHVGHLRSTILGDSICRLLRFAGHNVIAQNHVGDWGTQFGMIINYVDEKFTGDINDLTTAESEQLYKQAKALFDSDAEFAKQSRLNVTRLHNGDEDMLKKWSIIRDKSLAHCQQLYDRLSVCLTTDDVRGESSYNANLPIVIEDLQKAQLAKISDGAICVFPDGFRNKDDDPLAVIVQKSDGAYLYATTDLAAIRYRIDELSADEIIYITDARQKLHFEMIFSIARSAKWVNNSTILTHVTFGTVLGEDNKPFKTRSGENVKLADLLDEAVSRSGAVVSAKNPDLSDIDKTQIALAVGIGAVKYADLSNNRTSDYVFSFDKMLAMEGNTAPYMQYAYARICSIKRKALSMNIDVKSLLSDLTDLELTESAELVLASHLISYSQTIKSSLVDYRPNYLTNYLYELAQKFSSFYTCCPVLSADSASRRASRLLLCDLTARTIAHGLSDLLGIDVVDQM